MNKIIELKNLSYSYPGEKKEVLKNISFEVYEKELFSIIGPSGCGKTTLALTLNGLIPKSIRGKLNGSIIINGENIKEINTPVLAQKIQILFQNPDSQMFSLNVEDEIAFGLENLNLPWEEIKRRVNNVLNKLSISSLKDRSIEELSSGQKQRVALASVLAMAPSVLILDEPTANLDPIASENLLHILNKLKKEMTIILIEHNLNFIKKASDRIMLMDNGKKVKILKTNKMFKDKDFLRIMLPPKREKEIKEKIEEEKEKDIGEKILEIKNLFFKYPNNIYALKNISLNINRGDFFGIVGLNGSGKSTLALNIIGLLKGKGEILFNNKNIEKKDVYERTKNIGYVFQNPNYQLFEDTLYREIAFGPRNLGLSEREIRERTKEALNIISLEEFSKEDPHSLSVGQKRRATIASILSMKPSVIILDEPDTGLDYKAARKLMDYVKRLNKCRHTIIVISHNLELISDYCNEVIYLEDGEIKPIGRFLKKKIV